MIGLHEVIGQRFRQEPGKVEEEIYEHTDNYLGRASPYTYEEYMAQLTRMGAATWPIYSLKDALAKPALLPVRRRGPWNSSSGAWWERWHNGQFIGSGSRESCYSVQDGCVMCSGANKGLIAPGDELRAPKGYDGPCPEGCYFLDVEEKNGGR